MAPDRSILVIDDEQRLAESLADLLRAEGYDVESAVGGVQGILNLQRRNFQLIITDLRMPEVDGFQVMDAVAKHCPESALIVITGHASTESAIEAIHARVADYITKPFEFDFLLASIEKTFAKIEAEQLRDDMIRMISHDIKVPLNSIMGFAWYIVDDKTGQVNPKAAEYVEKIQINCQRIVGLLDNFLTNARAEAGRLDILAQPFRLDEAAEEAVKMLNGEFRRAGVELKADLQQIGAMYCGDENLLFRAISNMMNNAQKYTPKGGWARIWTRRFVHPVKGPCAEVGVENSGPGIPPADVAIVFKRFHRATSSRGIEGSGLGLYVVRLVSEAHGGWAECESEVNVSTRFRICLPLEGRLQNEVIQ